MCGFILLYHSEVTTVLHTQSKGLLSKTSLKHESKKESFFYKILFSNSFNRIIFEKVLKKYK
jgi:hypothetical protein